MSEQRPVEQQPYPPEQWEDEIELMDLLVVLWKWKWLIVLGSLLCAVAAAVISFQQPKVYSIDTFIRPGILRVLENGNNVYIESAQNLRALIEAGAFENKVLRRLQENNGDDLPMNIGFQVQIPKNSNAVKVTLETSEKNRGVQILKYLNEAILERYGALVNYYQREDEMKIEAKAKQANILQNKVSKIRNDIGTFQNENAAKTQQIVNKIAALEFDIEAAIANAKVETKHILSKIATAKSEREAGKNQNKNLEQRLADLRTEIGRISKNTDLLIEERNKFLSTAGAGNGQQALSSLIYSNTIQQNISYLNTLREAMNNVNYQLYQQIVSIESLGNHISDLEAERENIEKQKALNIDKIRSDISNLETEKQRLVKQTKFEIEKLKTEIDDLQTENKYVLGEIENIKFKKNSIQNIQTLQPPTPSPSPIKPKIRLNILLAGVVGLFLTVFLAFFLEYIFKYRKRETR